MASIWPENMLGCFSLEKISSTKLAVFLEPPTLGIFSRQMEAIVYIFLLVDK